MKHFRSAFILLVGLTIFVLVTVSPPSGLVQAVPSAIGQVYLPIVTGTRPTVIPATTEVLTEETTRHLVSLSQDGAVFTFEEDTSELSSVDVGDVIVGDVSDAAPAGFLRRVTEVDTSGDDIILHTSPATLEDAIEQGYVSLSKRLTPGDLVSMTAAPGVSLVSSPMRAANGVFQFSIKNVVLYDSDGDHSTTFDQVKANGSLQLSPAFDFDLSVRNRTLEELDFTFNLQETVDLELQWEVELLRVEARKEIARLHLGTVTVFAGPVPIVFLIEMPIFLCGDGQVTLGAVASVKQLGDLSAGLRYSDGDWTPNSNHTIHFEQEPPRLSAGAEIKGYVDPPLGLYLYGVAGPFAAANPFLKLEADVYDNPWWKLLGGVEATIGVRVDVLGKTIADQREVVISFEKALLQADGPFAGTSTPTSTATTTATPSITPTPTSSATSTPTASATPAPTASITPTLTPSPTPSGITSLISRHSDGTVGNKDSRYSSISADGRFVAFSSYANNLVSGDTNNRSDIFVHDRQTGETTRVSVSSSGEQGDYSSNFPALSADGRFVVFDSAATNLVSGDTNGESDIFIHDRQTKETTRVSVSSSGEQGNAGSLARPSISADGRFVAFLSHCDNLIIGDTNGVQDIFIHDRQTGETTRVSVSSSGEQGNDVSSGPPFLSADGRFVVFDSAATNLVSGDTNDEFDTFVHDRQTGETTRVSVSSSGEQGNGPSSGLPVISADGRFVAFQSDSDNLVIGDTNDEIDTFIHNRQTGETTRVSISSYGEQGNSRSYEQSLSADGRFVAFRSWANNLVPGDTNDVMDIFIHDRQTGETTRVSVGSSGEQGNGHSFWPSLSADGHLVVFDSVANELVAWDAPGVFDVFVHDQRPAP